MALSTEAPPGRVRHQNLHAHHLWMQQRFYAAFLVAVGLVMTGIYFYKGQIANTTGGLVWLIYIPSGLLLGGLFLYYRRRSHVHVLDSGVKVSTLLSSVTLTYESIRSVKAQPLRQHFQDGRSRLIRPVMKQYVDKPALFIRIRVDDSQRAQIQKTLGTKLMHEDTIAIPVPDADAAAWEISSRLPYRLGQNQGGKKRHKRRR
jgi:hypothetical protein